MRISEAITDLQKILEDHGDIEFCFMDYEYATVLVSNGIKVVFGKSPNGAIAVLHQDPE